ncbi:mll1786 [Mesorhizobium japonicum MAFF 303099]|uniref:Mll1786 protein n=1 Tax=Mesorhizobium japonicum (strain LMG 29417 / CECT 9101 / MAFF 303099) TaxID=266835 RepID=Q98JT9_RHILO|nr:mll1786 [Mesorhizobium japonicum MAFF 303099]
MAIYRRKNRDRHLQKAGEGIACFFVGSANQHAGMIAQRREGFLRLCRGVLVFQRRLDLFARGLVEGTAAGMRPVDQDFTGVLKGCHLTDRVRAMRLDPHRCRQHHIGHCSSRLWFSRYWRMLASRAASIIARIAFSGGVQPSSASRQQRSAAW